MRLSCFATASQPPSAKSLRHWRRSVAISLDVAFAESSLTDCFQRAFQLTSSGASDAGLAMLGAASTHLADISDDLALELFGFVTGVLVGLLTWAAADCQPC